MAQPRFTSIGCDHRPRGMWEECFTPTFQIHTKSSVGPLWPRAPQWQGFWKHGSRLGRADVVQPDRPPRPVIATACLNTALSKGLQDLTAPRPLHWPVNIFSYLLWLPSRVSVTQTHHRLCLESAGNPIWLSPTECYRGLAHLCNLGKGGIASRQSVFGKTEVKEHTDSAETTWSFPVSSSDWPFKCLR